MIDYYETKTQPITKKMVWEAYRKVSANGGSAGIDQLDLETYAEDLRGNLYKLWNRLTSGSYFPQPVREVKIPKKSGGYRALGIPTVDDRIAQQVVKSYLEPKVDGSFHSDSYGYRQGKNAHQAIDKAIGRCGRFAWVLDLDIKGFFDNLDHELMLKGLHYYIQEKWVSMYVERWLKTGVMRDGELVRREKGTPQGGVISPLLANIYLHITFDKWMERNYPHIMFERYCDDIIVHCRTEKEAWYLKRVIAERLAQCRLELNESKTQVVYCRSSTHRQKHEKVSFDFLGYTFRPRLCRTRNGLKLLFNPCMSTQAKKAVMDKLRRLNLHRLNVPVQRLAEILNPMLRGWINYYCRFGKWTTAGLWTSINLRLAKWLRNYRKFSAKRAFSWLRQVYKTNPAMFAHWQLKRP